MKLSEVDLNNLDAFEAGAPHDQFELLRKEAPIHRHAGPSGEEDYWCITKHEDLKMISKDPQLFSSERMSAIMRDPDPESLRPRARKGNHPNGGRSKRPRHVQPD